MKKIITIILTIVMVVQTGIIYKVSAYENKLVPADGKTLVFIGQDDDEVADYIKSTGIVPAGMMIYTNLKDLSAMTSSYQGTGANQAGRMDFQNWAKSYDNTVMNLAIWASDTSMLNSIVKGDYDENIKKLADIVQNANKPVYIRFGYEFDGPWNVYTPTLYKNAYKHFVDVVRKETDNYKNIAFVWHSAAFFRLDETSIWPNGTGSSKYDANSVNYYLKNPNWTLDRWYPGDEYVDWVGISWFAWEHHFQENAAKIRRDEAINFAKTHKKPVMIAEAAPKEVWQPQNPSEYCTDNGKNCSLGEVATTHSDDSWENWYKPMFDYIEKNNIKGLCYINQDWNKQLMWKLEGGWGDSRVQTNEEILKKWISKITGAGYLNSSDDLYSKLVTKSTDSDSNSQKVSAPKPVKIKKIIRGKKSLKVFWYKGKDVSGYEIRYSLKRNFKKSRKITIKKKNITSKKISGLKRKKRYYIRIRTFKKTGKRTYYSKWSNIKKVKTK